MRHASPALDEPAELAVGQMDGVREHGPLAEPAGAVVDVDVIERFGKQPFDLRDLALVLGHVRLPVRTGRGGEGRRFAQQVGRARDGEPRGDRVSEPAVVGPMPAVDQASTLGERPVEDGRSGRSSGRR